MEHIQRFIQESKKLMNYASGMSMATGYKVGEVNSANYARLMQEAEKEVSDMNMDKKDEVINKIVTSYFEQPEKKLKEVFAEYTEGFAKEEKEKFFANLRAIIN